MLHDLADKAPKDLTDEWQTFLGALDHLEKALKDAGVKPSDFEDGKPPAGLERGRPPGDHRRRRRRSPPTRSSQAANGIEQEGRDVCKVNLGL